MATNLKHFISHAQLTILRLNAKGEEAQFFTDMLQTVSERVDTMHKVYEQDGKGDAAVVHLHYFRGGMDWYITERDTTPEQHQAFGLVDMGYGAELGYVSIDELLRNGVELDLHWTPKTLGEVKAQEISK